MCDPRGPVSGWQEALSQVVLHVWAALACTLFSTLFQLESEFWLQWALRRQALPPACSPVACACPSSLASPDGGSLLWEDSVL